MNLHKDHDNSKAIPEFNMEDPKELQHKKKVRRLLEERLEEKRLRAEIEDEFDFDLE